MPARHAAGAATAPQTLRGVALQLVLGRGTATQQPSQPVAVTCGEHLPCGHAQPEQYCAGDGWRVWHLGMHSVQRRPPYRRGRESPPPRLASTRVERPSTTPVHDRIVSVGSGIHRTRQQQDAPCMPEIVLCASRVGHGPRHANHAQLAATSSGEQTMSPCRWLALPLAGHTIPYHTMHTYTSVTTHQRQWVGFKHTESLVKAIHTFITRRSTRRWRQDAMYAPIASRCAACRHAHSTSRIRRDTQRPYIARTVAMSCARAAQAWKVRRRMVAL